MRKNCGAVFEYHDDVRSCTCGVLRTDTSMASLPITGSNFVRDVDYISRTRALEIDSMLQDLGVDGRESET